MDNGEPTPLRDRGEHDPQEWQAVKHCCLLTISVLLGLVGYLGHWHLRYTLLGLTFFCLIAGSLYLCWQGSERIKGWYHRRTDAGDK